MCNSLHKDFEPIRPSGIGWKVLSPGGRSWALEQEYDKDSEGWIEWEKRFDNMGDGFCFFLDKEEARKMMLEMECEEVLEQIEYEGGLGTFPEYGIFGEDNPPLQITLCKRFRIIEEM